MVVILMMSTKLTTPGFCKDKGILQKFYDIVIFANAITNKTLSSDSNYTVLFANPQKILCQSLFIHKVAGSHNF